MNKFESLVLGALWVLIRYMIYGDLDGRDKAKAINIAIKIEKELRFDE